jgi:prepilin-type processing-associated H-X9-DG protein
MNAADIAWVDGHVSSLEDALAIQYNPFLQEYFKRDY